MKLLEIPISRFLAETPLTRDTFLFLPLNNKSICIARAGEVIAEPMLAKIKSKGHSHLRVAEGSEMNPDTFAVHSTEPQAPAGEQVSTLAQQPAEPLAAPAGEADMTRVVMAANDPANEPGVAIAADPAVAAESTTVAPLPTAEEPTQAFAADQNQEEISKVSAAEYSTEDEERIRAGLEEEEPEQHFGSAGEEKDEGQKFSGGQEPAEKYVRKFAPDKEPLPAVIRLQKKMAEAKEQKITIDLSSEKESALKEARTVILSSKISEKIISLAEHARTAEPSLRDSLRGQVRNLKSALDQVDNGDLSLQEKAEFGAKEEISAVVESLASASRVEQVEEITERLSAHALTRELAMSALEEQEDLEEKDLSRSATSRELPATVSRLAAYLGHSLGYTNVDFLADLGCGAIAHFAKKTGEAFNEELLPPFAKRIISSDEAIDDAVSDSREILQFLEAYIEDQECDRSHKDLMKRVFDRTMQDFSEKDDGPSALSLRKWSSFVDRGPTMDSHSICTRASAKAMKSARSAAR